MSLIVPGTSESPDPGNRWLRSAPRVDIKELVTLLGAELDAIVLAEPISKGEVSAAEALVRDAICEKYLLFNQG